tara:strand:- start:1262 stop:1951 length:690 start_codon:yes stop_codon:yes gene_type:complete
MRKIAIIPSKTPNIPKSLETYFEKAGWELYIMDGCSSIFEAYEKGINEANVSIKDYVIMCHDDIHILTNPEDFNSIIEGFLQKYKIGFAGVAGTKQFLESAVWWDGLQNPVQSHLSGFIYHGTNLMNMRATYYGETGRVAVLDGVFLACKGSTLRSIKLSKPEDFKGDWDFYDIYLTLQAHMKGLDNYTMPLQILHKSLGETAGKEGWHYNKEAIKARLWQKFPICINI